MKLFTKDIDKRLFQQYQNGSDLDSQVAVAKIFNPYGRGRWFLLNSDPQDKDYLWAIVQMGDVVEVGSVLRSELESVRVSPFKLPLERDLGFSMVNAGELYRGLLQGKFYNKGGTLMAASGMEVGRYYKDKNGDSFRYIGENSQRQTLFNDGQKVIVKSVNDFEDEPKEKKLFGIFEDGGEIKVGDFIRLKKDLPYMPSLSNLYDKDLKVDNVTETYFASGVRKFYHITHDGDKYEVNEDFVDNERMEHGGNVNEGKILFTINDDKIDELLSNSNLNYEFMDDDGYLLSEKDFEKFKVMVSDKGYDDDKIFVTDYNYANGGFVTKTDEELKAMNDDELFEYLDAKAAYMKQYAKPLSSFKAKNYAANSAAVQFKNEGTSKLDANFPSLSKINEQATKDYQETIAKRSDKMADAQVSIGSEGMYRGGAAKVLKYDDNNKMYAIKYLNKNGEVEGNFVMARKDDFEYGFSDFDPKMSDGGKVKFQDKVKAIKASLLKTKKVPKNVQKDYGKTYNAKEAELAAKRIAGAMAKKGMK